LDSTNKQLSESVNKLNSTIERVKPKIITTPLDDCKYSTFCLIKINRNNPYDKKRISKRRNGRNK